MRAGEGVGGRDSRSLTPAPPHIPSKLMENALIGISMWADMNSNML